MNVGAALAQARTQIDPAEAKLLLRHVLAASAAELTAHPERELSETQSSRYATLVARRAAGEPIAYLLGTREFYGREFKVTPAVLIPRPETELLVDVALKKVWSAAPSLASLGTATAWRPAPFGLVSHGDTPRILDLGVGSGCVAITLALELGCEVTAVDVSTEALVIARENANRLGARVKLIESDWFAAVDGRFDLIVGNPPYVPEGDPHLAEGDLRFEPMTALACGADGLEAIRRILDEAPRFLLPGGWLLLEHGYDQAEAMRVLLAATGFSAIEQHPDLAGIVRISGGCVDRHQ